MNRIWLTFFISTAVVSGDNSEAFQADLSSQYDGQTLSEDSEYIRLP